MPMRCHAPAEDTKVGSQVLFRSVLGTFDQFVRSIGEPKSVEKYEECAYRQYPSRDYEPPFGRRLFIMLIGFLASGCINSLGWRHIDDNPMLGRALLCIGSFCAAFGLIL